MLNKFKDVKNSKYSSLHTKVICCPLYFFRISFAEDSHKKRSPNASRRRIIIPLYFFFG